MTLSGTPTRIHAGAADEYSDGDRRLVEHDGRTIGVFRVDDEFRAYANECLHQGGPVCEGRYFPLMKAVVAADGRLVGEMHDESTPHLVCPWHGWEYDVKTGSAVGDRRRKLRRYDVESREDGIYVVD